MIKQDKFTTAETWIPVTGSDVKELMNSMNYNTIELSALLGVSEATVLRWINDKNQMPYSTWALLCIIAGYADIVQSDDTIKTLEAKVERHKNLFLKYSVMLKKHTEKVFNENQDNNE